jgi:hypothetical protein
MKPYIRQFENITIPLSKNDNFLYGKWKNKKAKVASFGKNEKGEDIIITDTGKEIPLLKIRLIKESVQAKQIYKELLQAGFKRYKTDRVNFKNVESGDYDLKQVNKYGINAIMIYTKDQNNIKPMMHILSKYNPEFKQGYIIIQR